MRLEHVPHGQISKLRLRLTVGITPASALPGTEAHLQFSDRSPDPLMTVGSDVFIVAGEGRKNNEIIECLRSQNFPRLIWIVEATPKLITVQIHTFLHMLELPPVDIGVDEKIIESLKRQNQKLSKMEKTIEWLRDQFLVVENAPSGEVRAFATANADVGNGAFALHGKSVRAFIRREKRPDKSDILMIDKVVGGKSQTSEPLALVRGVVRFVDATVAGKLRADVAAELSSLVTSGSSFLELWSRYGAMENEAALRRARRIGWLEYDHIESLPEGCFRFSLTVASTQEKVNIFKKAMKEEVGLSIEATSSVPEVLTRDMTWTEYAALPR